jgi:hypothetical protein
MRKAWLHEKKGITNRRCLAMHVEERWEKKRDCWQRETTPETDLSGGVMMCLDTPHRPGVLAYAGKVSMNRKMGVFM